MFSDILNAPFLRVRDSFIQRAQVALEVEPGFDLSTQVEPVALYFPVRPARVSTVSS